MHRIFTFILVVWSFVAFSQQSVNNKQLRQFELAVGEGDIKFTIHVIDRLEGKPVSGADVTIYKTEKNYRILKSRKNGKCDFNLNSGTYKLLIKDKRYRSFLGTISVGSDGVEYEKIYLHPKKGIKLVPVQGSKI